MNLFSQGVWAEIKEQATSSGSAQLICIRLADVLKRTILAAKASGTVNYSNSLKRWIEFSKDRNLVPLPATVVDIALFFSHITFIGVSASLTVMVNGGHVLGSPFTDKVQPFQVRPVLYLESKGSYVGL